MQISSSTALVTGANRGLGLHFAQQLRDRGATVYAAASNPEQISYPGVVPVRIDVTDQTTIDAALAEIGPVAILVNNAGSATGAGLLTGDPARIRTFAPAMAGMPESAILNVLSVLSWLTIPEIGAYCAAKSAAWSMTNAVRLELAPQGTRVTALHVGYIDTDMSRRLDVPKQDPADVARLAIEGIERGDHEVLADELSGHVRQGLAGGVSALYPQLAAPAAP